MYKIYHKIRSRASCSHRSILVACFFIAEHIDAVWNDWMVLILWIRDEGDLICSDD